LEDKLKELHEDIKTCEPFVYFFWEATDPLGIDSWENKAKFPPNLKPRLTAVALEALKLGEYNENFFNYLPKIFPYNRFTMLVSLSYDVAIGG
jgi:hypothetical protein